MTSKRRRERKAAREKANETQQRTLLIVGGALVIAIAAALIIFAVPKAAKPVSTANDGTLCGKFPAYTGQEKTPPALAIDTTKNYTAQIIIAKGTINVNLFAADAPQTVNSFIYLACSHFYDNLTFHRVIPGFVAQGGDPSGNGSGGPSYNIPDEFSKSTRKFDKPGLLSMALSGPNTGGSQFFITLADTQSTQNLSGQFTIFGEVADDASMKVAQSITPRDPEDPATSGNTAEVIQTITVAEK